MRILEASLVTGALGDVALQCMVADSNRWGLGEYFRTHGRAESICIAAGMMSLLNGVYLQVDPSAHVVPFLLYGACLDILFRYTHEWAFPSLKGYYKALTPSESIAWGVIPQGLVLLVARTV